MLIIPKSFPYARALEGLTSESEPFFKNLAQSLTWRGKPIAARYWRNAWRREAWIKRLSGRMLEPSMESPALEQWMLSLGVTHASLSPSQAIVRGKATQGIYGHPSCVLSENPSPGSASSKTSPIICGWDFEASPKTYDDWVTKLRRHCGQRRKSAQATSESGCSLWPTPKADLGAARRIKPTPAQARREAGADLQVEAILHHYSLQDPKTLDGPTSSLSTRRLNPRFVEWLMGWPIGWTAFEPLETGSYLSKQRARFESLQRR